MRTRSTLIRNRPGMADSRGILRRVNRAVPHDRACRAVNDDGRIPKLPSARSRSLHRVDIRSCTKADRARVIALWEQIFPDDPPHNAPPLVFDAKLAMNDGLLFVATDADTAVGTVMAGYDGHRGWLYAVAVSPPYRRRGIGTALVRHAVAALRATGCSKVNLQVRAANHAVVGFYASLGFAVEERVSMGMHIS